MMPRLACEMLNTFVMNGMRIQVHATLLTVFSCLDGCGVAVHMKDSED